MPRLLHISGGRHPRPDARRVAYCDGGTDERYRDGTDVELSHWIPNRTPVAFKASTSTEICLRFAEHGALAEVDLVVNNHVDTDGMLSVFSLLHPELALAHRGTLAQAAAMGDFGAWGQAEAQHLFQLVALTRQRLEASRTDPQDIYLEVHALVRRALQGERFAETEAGVAALQAAAAAVEQGRIRRRLLAPRLVHFELDAPAAEAQWLAPLDAPLDAQAVLPTQARAQHDLQRLQLVSLPHGPGWQHALCWPGYCWAETVGLWRPAGQHSEGTSNRHRLEVPALDEAAQRLAAMESAAGDWGVARQLSPFAALPGRRFPVVLSFMQGTQPAPSALAPAVVAEVLTACLDGV